MIDLLMHRAVLLAILLGLNLAATVAAQCPYTLDAPRYVGVPPAESVIVGIRDFDGDGRPDLVTPHSIVYGFSRVVPLSEGDVVLRAVGDFNGDGQPDVIATGSSGIRAYLNRGDGTFTAVDTAAPPTVAAVVGDFNHDGFDDVVLFSSNTGYAYLSDGKGRFAQTQELISTAGLDSRFRPAVADFNGDGNLDFTFNRFYAGDGKGHFSQLNVFVVSSIIGAGNIYGDGQARFVILGSPGIWVMNPAPTVGYTQIESIPTNPSSPFYGGTVADLNGDGVADLVLQDNDRSVNVFLNDGHGRFGPPVATGIVSTGFAAPPATANVNGDGIPDLVLQQIDSIVAFPGNGDGTFQQARRTGARGAQAFSGDFDGDGRGDVILDQGGGEADVIWHAAVSGTVQHVKLPFDFVLAVADIDGDGLSEIIGGQRSASFVGSIVIARLRGDATIMEQTRFTVDQSISALAAGRFLGHDRLDLALPGAIYDLTAPAAPATTFPFPALGAFESFKLVATDLNRDGVTDLVFGKVCTNNLVSPCRAENVLVLTAAKGSFVTTGTFSTFGTAAGPIVGDLDGDGVPDLALFDLLLSPYWLKGRGDGTFESKGPIPFALNAGDQVQSFDIDGDGYDDIISFNPFHLAITFGGPSGPSRMVKYAVFGGKSVAVIRNRGARLASLLVAGDDTSTILTPSCGRTRAAGRP